MKPGNSYFLIYVTRGLRTFSFVPPPPYTQALNASEIVDRIIGLAVSIGVYYVAATLALLRADIHSEFYSYISVNRYDYFYLRVFRNYGIVQN